MLQSHAYILNSRPFRDSSLIVDLFSEDYGRICCIARPARKRGKIIKGMLEPFRYLHCAWLGKGEMQTLSSVDERGRHRIPAAEMMLGIYLNELLLLLTHRHVAMPALFSAYKHTLHKLADPQINRQILMRFEVYLLTSLGYPLEMNKDAIDAQKRYLFDPETGLLAENAGESSGGQPLRSALTRSAMERSAMGRSAIMLSGKTLLALQDIQNMPESHWRELRIFLDQVFRHLAPRPINARKLLRF